MKKRILLIGAAVLLVAGGAVGAFVLLRTPAPQGPLVVIDAGHGGSFSANTGIGGLKEADVNLAIAKRLRKKLLARDYRVIMTRTSDADVAEKTVPSWLEIGAPGRAWAYGFNKTSPARTAALDSELQARVDVANHAGADVFVSIHNNASKDAAIRGAETYAYRGDAPGKALAASVLDAVLARTGSDNHGSHESDLYVCRWTNMPAVLVECAYYTNEQDAKALGTSDFQDRIADGVVDGIDRWFTSYPLRAIEPQIAGPDPSGLACAVSSAAYPDGAKVAVVLPAENPELGPSASALAVELGGPLLVASASSISASTGVELRRLQPERVVIVAASDAADSKSIGVAVTEAVGNRTQVDLLAEKTAPAAAALAAASIGVPADGTVVVVDARDTAALTALAPYVAQARVPVLLSEGARLGEDGAAVLSANRDRVKRILAVGHAEKPAEPSGWPVTVVSSSDSGALAARVLALIDPARAEGKLAPLVVDAAQSADVFTAATEAARRKQPLVQLSDGILGPYSREFLTNHAAAVDGFLILRDGQSIRPVSESALRKSIGR